MTKIHPTAIIHEKTQLGKNVTIGPFTAINENVIIGDNTIVGQNVLIDGHTHIGQNCQIFMGAVLGTAPQDLKYTGEVTYLEIGDNTVIREYATLNLATGENEKTIIGKNCLLMAYTHVAHNCIIGNNVILSNAVNLAGHITIEDFAIIGGLTGVHQFVYIGQHSFIGGMCRVSRDVLPYIRVASSPTSFNISGLNSVGLKRRGFSNESILALKKAYKILFRSGLKTSDALDLIKTEVAQLPEVKKIISFIEDSMERSRNPEKHGQGLAK